MQSIIFHFIINVRHLLPLRTNSLLHTGAHPSQCILLGHPPLAVIGLCFLLSVHCLARCWFFVPECFHLVRCNDCAHENGSFACMAAPMTGLTDHLSWTHVWSTCRLYLSKLCKTSDVLPSAEWRTGGNHCENNLNISGEMSSKYSFMNAWNQLGAYNDKKNKEIWRKRVEDNI